MKNQKLENNNNFLAKWLVDDISSEEMEQFKLSPNYSQYVDIVEGISKLKTEHYSEDQAYAEFKERLEVQNTIENNDHFLGRWLDDAVAPEELEVFKGSKDYEIYTSITEGLSKLKTKAYDEDLAYAEFKEKLNKNNKKPEVKVVKMSFFKLTAIAASLLLLLGFGYFATNVTYETQIAQLENIVLPDNSKVTLNAKSTLTYNKVLFSLQRKLNLTGEAFFEVEKGSNFTVQSTHGTVQVLGTKFNVISRNEYFETTCFEGKVSVSKSDNKDILSSGQQVRYIKESKENNTVITSAISSPKWLEGISEYKSTPIQYVLENLEAHFDVAFDLTKLENKEALFSGQFPHNNLDEALENVLLPMGIRYTKEADTIVLETE